MRKIKNIQLVKFACDKCKRETGFRPHESSEDNISGVHPFPYTEGWIYMHELFIKISPDHRLMLNRVHFCCEDCFRAYVQSELDKLNLTKRRKN